MQRENQTSLFSKLREGNFMTKYLQIGPRRIWKLGATGPAAFGENTLWEMSPKHFQICLVEVLSTSTVYYLVANNSFLFPPDISKWKTKTLTYIYQHHSFQPTQLHPTPNPRKSCGNRSTNRRRNRNTIDNRSKTKRINKYRNRDRHENRKELNRTPAHKTMQYYILIKFNVTCDYMYVPPPSPRFRRLFRIV